MPLLNAAIREDLLTDNGGHPCPCNTPIAGKSYTVPVDATPPGRVPRRGQAGRHIGEDAFVLQEQVGCSGLAGMGRFGAVLPEGVRQSLLTASG
ncbi:hypothetical protein ABZ793_24395 [Micromonospora sp. NPDC047465]|uniref:hypothetical protein n=1 Tax=Micromonospora sp. NPDC047465 TaxID=3154813 RepID=UPI0033D5AB8C